MRGALLLCASVSLFAQVPQFAKNGNILLPENYRDWVYLSSSIGLTYNDTPPANPLFDTVFVNPPAYRAFLKTGTWPDRTIFVMETRKSAPERNGHYLADLTGF